MSWQWHGKQEMSVGRSEVKAGTDGAALFSVTQSIRNVNQLAIKFQ